MLTTDQKGAIAEAAIAFAAVKLGIDVYKPLSDGTRYDLIIDVGAGEVDAFAVYCHELESVYFLPLSRFHGQSHIHLRLARRGTTRDPEPIWLMNTSSELHCAREGP